MCLGIPMEINRIEGFTAHCKARGAVRDVSLFMLQHEKVAVGDFIVVHLGYAIEKVSRHEAQIAWQLYDEMIQQAETIEGGAQG